MPVLSGLPAVFVSCWIVARVTLDNKYCWTTHENSNLFLLIRVPTMLSILVSYVRLYKEFSKIIVYLLYSQVVVLNSSCSTLSHSPCRNLGKVFITFSTLKLFDHFDRLEYENYRFQIPQINFGLFVNIVRVLLLKLKSTVSEETQRYK